MGTAGNHETEKIMPYILEETGDFAVVFKPPGMHCAPLHSGESGTLFGWYAAVFPPVMRLCGKKLVEGGLVHRLDFETSGLVLFAKNQKSLDSLAGQQAGGIFVKEYTAVCLKDAETGKSGTTERLPGFPPAPFSFTQTESLSGLAIESFFRPFGPGRKQVRPVARAVKPQSPLSKNRVAGDQGWCYRTEILAAQNIGESGLCKFELRLKRGFRHQIRCHLAWVGCPILNDPVYSNTRPSLPFSFMALSSTALSFDDPETGIRRNFRISPPDFFST